MRGLPAWIVLAALTLCGCSAGEAPAAAPDASGFHLLLVSIDTLRADRLGCYGNGDGLTPELDALAATGLRYAHATAGTPITLPSHATLMTGLDAPSHGVRHNGTFRLAPEHRTLAERLAEAGYATAAFVGAFVLDSHYGLDQGFEHYDDAVNPGGSSAGDARYVERPADAVIDAAVSWLDAHLDSDTRPFFAWVHLFDPHGPYEPPPEFAGRSDSPYDGEVAFSSAQVGRLTAMLEARGALDRTLVVLTADHGEGLGEHDEPTHGALIYDATMRVPLIFSNPVLFPEATVVDDRVAGLVDVVPTLLVRLGVETGDAPLDGVDLAAAADTGRGVYIESLLPLLDFGWSPLHGLRTRDGKFVLAPTPEHYDLATDPGETVNLYPDDARGRVLEQALALRLERWPDAERALREQQPLDREAYERLAALGYVRAGGGPVDRRADPKEMMPVANRIQRAGQLAARGDLAGGLREVEAVLAEHPDVANGWYTATRIFDRMGRYDRAEACLRRALLLSPRSDGYTTLARYALQRGDREAFDEALDAAERIDPGDAGVHLGRGFGLAQQGRFEEALREFRTVVEIDPARYGPQAREQIAKLEKLLGG